MIVFREPLSAVKWIFPGVVIAWAMAMTIFRAPAISLIGKYKSANELPIVMSLLTLVGGAIGSLKPVVQNFILSLGAPIAFTIASIVLLATTAILRYFDPPLVTPSAFTKRQPIVLFDIALLIGTGFGIAWGSRCLLETIPRILALYVPQSNVALITMAISLAVAISALPGGVFATKYGNRRVMLIGIGSVLLALLTIVSVQNPIAMMGAILSTIACLSWVINGAVPLAISIVPTDRQGLAVGSYFGGFSAGMSSFSLVFNPVSNLTPVLGAIGGTFGLILAGVCVWQSNKSKALPGQRTI
jgi:hypothetical protein